MRKRKDDLPLNSIRAFAVIARYSHVSRAADELGISQSAASRHLAILEEYLGGPLVERRGRNLRLTDLGQQFSSSVGPALEEIAFAARQMRRNKSDRRRLVIRTSLPTFAVSWLIPNIDKFSKDYPGASVDIMTSLAPPDVTEDFDILISRDIEISEPSVQWNILDESIVCVTGRPENASLDLPILLTQPIISVASRPDILPAWLSGLGLSASSIKLGPRYDHHYLALPAVMSGLGLLVAPEIVVADLVRQNILTVVPNTRVTTGMTYRVYALDRSPNTELTHDFCRWLVKLCRNIGTP